VTGLRCDLLRLSLSGLRCLLVALAGYARAKGKARPEGSP